jgi:hypothetical protein
MSQGQKEVNQSMKEIIGLIRSDGDGRASSGKEPHEIMEQINKSMSLIATC